MIPEGNPPLAPPLANRAVLPAIRACLLTLPCLVTRCDMSRGVAVKMCRSRESRAATATVAGNEQNICDRGTSAGTLIRDLDRQANVVICCGCSLICLC